MESHLLQMRGLKPISLTVNAVLLVASFTDAWIETAMRSHPHHRRASHLLQMRGLKPHLAGSRTHFVEVASFTDAWIETALGHANIKSAPSRIFYRCVD